MSGYPSRIPPAIWIASVNQATAVSNITATSGGGIAIPKGYRHEFAHLALTKNCTATIKVWGYANISNTTARWAQLDTLSFAETGNECTLVRGVAAFDRVQISINAIGSGGAINTSWGFSE